MKEQGIGKNKAVSGMEELGRVHSSSRATTSARSGGKQKVRKEGTGESFDKCSFWKLRLLKAPGEPLVRQRHPISTVEKPPIVTM